MNATQPANKSAEDALRQYFRSENPDHDMPHLEGIALDWLRKSRGGISLGKVRFGINQTRSNAIKSTVRAICKRHGITLLGGD